MTKAEQAYQQRVRELGCICCLITLDQRSPCEIHHRLSGGRRMGEKKVLGLCWAHHRGGFDGRVTALNPLGIVSRDHNQRRFERTYGTEESLQQQADERMRIAA